MEKILIKIETRVKIKNYRDLLLSNNLQYFHISKH